jgi:hypothetical protein
LCVARLSSVPAQHKLQSVAIPNPVEWHQQKWEARSTTRRIAARAKPRQYRGDTDTLRLFGLLRGHCRHRCSPGRTSNRVYIGGGRGVCLQGGQLHAGDSYWHSDVPAEPLSCGAAQYTQLSASSGRSKEESINCAAHAATQTGTFATRYFELTTVCLLSQSCIAWISDCWSTMISSASLLITGSLP